MGEASLQSALMCNLYHMSPKEEVIRYFRALPPPDYAEAPVGPFGRGGFLRPDGAGGLSCVIGQWGMIAPGSKTRRPASRAVLTNNARIEGVAERITYKGAWRNGQRCLIPAAWYQEPNWETGRNIWWQLRRADGLPWALAGLWSEWVDPGTGEVVSNYTLLTCNCDGHPLLSRLHKPDPNLPPDAQDKRSVVHVDPTNWETWLHGSESDARALIKPPSTDLFDLSDAHRTDLVMAQMRPAQQSLL